jgi:hypothetical protein
MRCVAMHCVAQNAGMRYSIAYLAVRLTTLIRVCGLLHLQVSSLMMRTLVSALSAQVMQQHDSLH